MGGFSPDTSCSSSWPAFRTGAAGAKIFEEIRPEEESSTRFFSIVVLTYRRYPRDDDTKKRKKHYFGLWRDFRGQAPNFILIRGLPSSTPPLETTMAMVSGTYGGHFFVIK